MNTIILLVLKVIVSVVFFLAGGAKLIRAKPLVAQFHEFKLPLEIMYLVGVVEIIGAVAIWIDFLTLWAFSGLGLLMLGAMKNHFVAGHPFVRYIPAAVLFLLCSGGALMFNWLQ